MEVLPRKYRFRILNAGMSRFIQLRIASSSGTAVPFRFIANDGNLVVNPILLTTLDQQGMAERYDIVVDFSTFPIGSRIKLVNRVAADDGRKPEEIHCRWRRPSPASPRIRGLARSWNSASSARSQSVDVPGAINRSTDPDPSQVPNVLTQQIPVVTPVGNGSSSSAGPATATRATRRPANARRTARNSRSSRGPSRSTGEDAHTMNANGFRS